MIGKGLVKGLVKRLAKNVDLKSLLIRVGDNYVQATRSETDDKVWKKIKELIKEL